MILIGKELAYMAVGLAWQVLNAHGRWALRRGRRESTAGGISSPRPPVVPSPCPYCPVLVLVLIPHPAHFLQKSLNFDFKDFQLTEAGPLRDNLG